MYVTGLFSARSGSRKHRRWLEQGEGFPLLKDSLTARFFITKIGEEVCNE